MSLTVSISELRNNMSAYLDKVLNGTLILIRDEKKNVTIAQITKSPHFDQEAYDMALEKASGVFSKENHPEWSTKAKVKEWLTKSRLADERTF